MQTPTMSPYFPPGAADSAGSPIQKESDAEPDTVMRKDNAAALTSAFYSQPCHVLAKGLLGKTLVRQLADGSLIKGRIVETESYPGDVDKASHSFNGRQTPRNAAMFDRAGTAYVYFIYGMYHCFNISALEPGAGVLIRALEPVDGIDTMRALRKGGSTTKLTQLCNGPSRLCQAFNITTPVFNRHYLPSGENLWVEDDDCAGTIKIVECGRVGIESYGAEWAKKPWRYYILDSPFVSKRDKSAEMRITAEYADATVAASGDIVKKSTRKKQKVA